MRIKSIKRVKVDPTPVYDVMNVAPYHNFTIVTDSGVGVVSHNCAFLDEMNFYEKGGRSANNQELMNTPIMRVYLAIKRRIESRFMMRGEIPGKLFLVSSKSTEDSPLEIYSETQKFNPSALVVDEPIWVIHWSPDKYSGQFFNLLVGNAYTSTRILSPSEDVEVLKLQGDRVIQVPVEHREAFESGPNQALTDIAGIAIVSGARFMDGSKYLDVIREDPPNAFILDVITSGVGTPDKLIDYMDLSVLARYSGKPLWIHVDASKSNDKTGIAAVHREDGYLELDRVVGVTTESQMVRDYRYDVAFVTSIKAPLGDQIPYRKMLELMIDLRSIGINIVKITMDTYQSVMLLQEFRENGFDAGELSVDRTPQPYSYLRIAVNEGRISIPPNELLKTEIIELEEDMKTGKVDHRISGCLVEDTMIRTSNGDKRIVDLVEGVDKVIAYDMELKRYVEVDFRDLRKTRDTPEIYEIITEDGVVECTGNHLILTDQGYVMAQHLVEGDRIVSMTPTDIFDRLLRSDGTRELVKESIERNKDVLIDLYANQYYSTIDLVHLTGYSRTTLQTYLSSWGVLRNKSEAQVVAMKKYSSEMSNSMISSSKAEMELYDYLVDRGYEVIPQFIIRGYNHRYDILVKDLNLVIEVDGEYWHGESEEYDRVGTDYAIKAGFRVVRVSAEDCTTYGPNLYEKIISGEYDQVDSNSEESLRLVESLDARDRRSEYRRNRYSRGYRGFTLEDHPKYRDDVTWDDVQESLKKSRVPSDIYKDLGISQNMLRRLVRENSEKDIKQWLLENLEPSKWEDRVKVSNMIDSGELPKGRFDLITRNEFLEYYESLDSKPTLRGMFEYFGRSRNYVIAWFHYIMGGAVHEWTQ